MLDEEWCWPARSARGHAHDLLCFQLVRYEHPDVRGEDALCIVVHAAVGSSWLGFDEQ